MNGNTVTLCGNITADPELRFTASGQATATFGIAINRKWDDKATGEKKESVSFFDVVCWQAMAENVSESCSKGDRVIVVGRLEQRTWEDKDTGGMRYKVEVVADEVGPSVRWATAQVVKNERQSPAPQKAATGARRR